MSPVFAGSKPPGTCLPDCVDLCDARGGLACIWNNVTCCDVLASTGVRDKLKLHPLPHLPSFIVVQVDPGGRDEGNNSVTSQLHSTHGLHAVVFTSMSSATKDRSRLQSHLLTLLSPLQSHALTALHHNVHRTVCEARYCGGRCHNP